MKTLMKLTLDNSLRVRELEAISYSVWLMPSDSAVVEEMKEEGQHYQQAQQEHKMRRQAYADRLVHKSLGFF